MSDAALMTLVKTIVTADDTVAFRLLAANPALAKARFEIGATRQTAETFYLDEIEHYIYAGDTALHLAAAAYRQEIVPNVVPSPFTTPPMACRAHTDGTRPHKRRRLPISSKQAPIQMPPIKAE
jgi:hypothetical protein